MTQCFLNAWLCYDTQLTSEQHGFELCRSFYMHFFQWTLQYYCTRQWQLTDSHGNADAEGWPQSCAQFLRRVQLCATPWTAAHQAPLSMGFLRQAYWRRLSFPSLGDLPDPWIKPGSLAPEFSFFCFFCIRIFNCTGGECPKPHIVQEPIT